MPGRTMTSTSLQHTTMYGQARGQVVHLVGKNVAARKNKVLRPGWNIGEIDQRHAGLIGSSASLPFITGATSSHHVFPNIPAFLSQRDNVIPRHVMALLSTVRADATIAFEQQLVLLAETQRPHMLTEAFGSGKRDHCRNVNLTATASSLESTVQNKCIPGTERPRHLSVSEV